MKYYTKTLFKRINGRYVVAAEHSRLYFGPVELSKGASSEEKDIEKSNQELNKILIGAYNTAFANQTAVFNAVRAVFDPIFQAGPGQYGFSKAEDATLRTQASEGTAADYRMVSSTLAQQMAARGGGNTFLPSGVDESIRANIAGAAARQESEQQLGITRAGYDVGRQNFLTAANAEMGVAAGYNPLGYAGAATTSGKDVFGMASEITKENQAASPWGTIGGIIGGGLSAFLGNPAIGGFLGNKGSSGGPAPTPGEGTGSAWG